MKAVAELVEVAARQRMLDGLLAGVRLQVPLGHVGRLVGPVYEDVVPGLVHVRSMQSITHPIIEPILAIRDGGA